MFSSVDWIEMFSGGHAITLIQTLCSVITYIKVQFMCIVIFSDIHCKNHLKGVEKTSLLIEIGGNREEIDLKGNDVEGDRGGVLSTV